MKIFIIVMVAFFLLASIVQADSFRCGSRVVSTGDSKADVIIKCGPPDYSEVTTNLLFGHAETDGLATAGSNSYALFGFLYAIYIEDYRIAALDAASVSH